MKARAEAKYIRIPSTKVKPVCDLIRGKGIEEAKLILQFTPTKSARELLQVLDSAVANAVNNHDMEETNLFISQVYANQGPHLKRWKAGSHGRAMPRLRRTSHIGIVVEERE